MLIHYSPSTTLPPPWQLDWYVTPVLRFPSLPERRVARAPEGTPIPDGCERYVPPVVTDDHRKLARADLLIDTTRDRPYLDLARAALDDPEQLDRVIRAWLGEAHITLGVFDGKISYAELAPLSVATLSAACAAHVRAEQCWDSRHSSVVVRCAPRGYDVWAGLGGLMERAGRADDYASAEALGVEAVRQRRRETLRRVREEILAGWSPETPYYTSTIARAEFELPIVVRRGPITAEELGAEGAINHSCRPSPCSSNPVPGNSCDFAGFQEKIEKVLYQSPEYVDWIP